MDIEDEPTMVICPEASHELRHNLEQRMSGERILGEFVVGRLWKRQGVRRQARHPEKSV